MTNWLFFWWSLARFEGMQIKPDVNAWDGYILSPYQPYSNELPGGVNFSQSNKALTNTIIYEFSGKECNKNFYFNGTEIAIHSLRSRFMFCNAMLLVQSSVAWRHKKWLRGEFVNFPCFGLSAFAQHQSIPPTPGKKSGARAVNLQIAINISTRKGRCGSRIEQKERSIPPLRIKSCPFWMRAVQIIRLFSGERGKA